MKVEILSGYECHTYSHDQLPEQERKLATHGGIEFDISFIIRKISEISKGEK